MLKVIFKKKKKKRNNHSYFIQWESSTVDPNPPV